MGTSMSAGVNFPPQTPMALAKVWQSPQKPASTAARALPPAVEGERRAKKELRTTTKQSNDQAIDRAGRDGAVCEEDCVEVDGEPVCCLRETWASAVKRRMAIDAVLMCAVCVRVCVWVVWEERGSGSGLQIPKSRENKVAMKRGWSLSCRLESVRYAVRESSTVFVEGCQGAAETVKKEPRVEEG